MSTLKPGAVEREIMEDARKRMRTVSPAEESV